MVDIHSLKFIQLSKEQTFMLVDWAKKEGWNPGLMDAEIFWETDNEGFYGFFSGDEMIAGGAIVSYNGNFGFMGLFIVKQEYRHWGIGKKLWYLRKEKLLSRLKTNATIGMDGVVDMQPFYAKGGFNLAFKDERYVRLGKKFIVDDKVSAFGSEYFDKVNKYDSDCFGFERRKFLELWLQSSAAKTFVYQTDGDLQGFAVIRKANEGYKIGPLFANNITVAKALYEACLDYAVDEKVFLDIPLSNELALQLVAQFQALPVFQCGRMYCGVPPEMPLSKIFGITSFELG